jgi:hypothetical protein
LSSTATAAIHHHRQTPTPTFVHHCHQTMTPAVATCHRWCQYPSSPHHRLSVAPTTVAVECFRRHLMPSPSSTVIESVFVIHRRLRRRRRRRWHCWSPHHHPLMKKLTIIHWWRKRQQHHHQQLTNNSTIVWECLQVQTTELILTYLQYLKFSDLQLVSKKTQYFFCNLCTPRWVSLHFGEVESGQHHNRGLVEDLLLTLEDTCPART